MLTPLSHSYSDSVSAEKVFADSTKSAITCRSVAFSESVSRNLPNGEAERPEATSRIERLQKVPAESAVLAIRIWKNHKHENNLPLIRQSPVCRSCVAGLDRYM